METYHSLAHSTTASTCITSSSRGNVVYWLISILTAKNDFNLTTITCGENRIVVIGVTLIFPFIVRRQAYKSNVVRDLKLKSRK